MKINNSIKVSALNDFIKSVDVVIKSASKYHEFLFITKTGCRVENGDTKVFMKHPFGFDIVVDYVSVKKLLAGLSKDDVISFEKMNYEAYEPDLYVYLDGHMIMNIKHQAERYSESKEVFSEIFGNNIKQLGKLVPADINTIINQEKFTSNDSLRPVMQCVNMSDYIVATDSHLLSFHKPESPISTVPIVETVLAGMGSKQNVEDVIREYSLIITPIALKVLKAFNNQAYNVYFGWIMKKDQLKWAEDSTDTIDRVRVRLVSELVTIEFSIPGRFLDWKGVVPNFDKQYSPFKEYFINRSQFLKTLKIGKISNPGIVGLKFNKVLSEIQLYSEDIDSGTKSQKSMPFIEMTDYSFEGESSTIEEIGFHSEKLERILSTSKEREFSIKVSTATRAMVIDSKYLLMPVELREGIYN